MKWMLTKFGYPGQEYYYFFDTEDQAKESERRLNENKLSPSFSLGIKQVSEKEMEGIKTAQQIEFDTYFKEQKSAQKEWDKNHEV